MKKLFVFVVVSAIVLGVLITAGLYFRADQASTPLNKDAPVAAVPEPSSPEIPDAKNAALPVQDEDPAPDKKKEANSEEKPAPEGLPAAGPGAAAETESDDLATEKFLPKNLIDPEFEALLMVDETGHLVKTPELRFVYDYFISLLNEARINEEPTDAILERIENYLYEELPPTAADEAWDIFDSYAAYQQQLEELGRASEDIQLEDLMSEDKERISSIKDLLEQRIDMRFEYMDPEVVDTFFGYEQIQDEMALKILEIQGDTTLTEQEKMEHMAALEQEFQALMSESEKKEMDRELE